MDEPGPGLVALIAAAASFLFTLVESALEHHSGPRLLEIARRKNREAPVSSFLKSDERYLLTFQALSLVAQAALVMAVYVWVREGADGPTSLLLVKAAAYGALALLTVGRVVPLVLGRLFPESLLLALGPVIHAVHLVFFPLTWLMILVTGFTQRIAGKPRSRNGHDTIHEEILSAVEEGEMEGVIREEEAEIIEGALDLRDADAADCMTPRTRMFALQIKTPLPDAVKEVSEAGHSRVPVYRGNLDEVVGVLYAKDVLAHWATPEAKNLTLSRIARKPFFVPETKKLSQLLDEFKRTQTHMAIVLDEYGGTAGLITIEDIIEELVGDIEDEFDEIVDIPLLTMVTESEAEADGQLHVDDLGDALEVKIPSDEFDTVGGLVFTALGRIPQPGEEFDYAGLHFTVLDANDRRVNRVKAVRTSP